MCWWGCCSYKHFENISWFCLKSCLGTAYGWVNWVISTFTKFLLFFVIPITVQVIEGAHIWIRLMITSKIEALEWVRTWFILFGLEFRRIRLLICLIIPCKLAVMFRFVEAIILDAFSISESIWECYISSLSAVLTLRNAWVHVSTPDSSDVVFYIKASVNESFSLATILDILYVNLDNSYIRSREYLNDMRYKC